MKRPLRQTCSLAVIVFVFAGCGSDRTEKEAGSLIVAAETAIEPPMFPGEEACDEIECDAPEADAGGLEEDDRGSADSSDGAGDDASFSTDGGPTGDDPVGDGGGG